ncbi:MAG TPA: GNAT family protein [Acidimicrobiales bacterium]|nr:GNAT family protein [Acidimicrobiales bacterium]
MAHPYWPLYDLRITTPRLEIRLPTDDELFRLLVVTDEGIHDPATMPFGIPWTDIEPPRRHRDSLQWWWSRRASWRPDDWVFTGAAFVDGTAAGVQDLVGKSFAALRCVSTGSWLGRAYQGNGLGKEMRAAILHLAFEGLGAEEAYTGAFADNHASRGVCRALGYAENGHELVLRRGQPARHLGFRLDRDTWSSRRRSDITLTGLETCKEMFGLES